MLNGSWQCSPLTYNTVFTCSYLILFIFPWPSQSPLQPHIKPTISLEITLYTSGCPIHKLRGPDQTNAYQLEWVRYPSKSNSLQDVRSTNCEDQTKCIARYECVSIGVSPISKQEQQSISIFSRVHRVSKSGRYLRKICSSVHLSIRKIQLGSSSFYIRGFY